MKKILIGLILVIASLAHAYSQTCNCPPNKFGYPEAKKADTVFHLSNGRSIALCGYKDTEVAKGRTLFSEFVLAGCGEKNIIKFWGAVKLCQLHVNRDTLLIETLDSLPTGKNLQYKWTVWTIERVFFKEGRAVKDFNINRQITRYSEQQVQAVLKESEQAIFSAADANAVNNVDMEIADKLFICALSGSKQARAYLNGFDKHFGGLSGEYLEWYNDLVRKLKEWDTNAPSDEHS